MATTDRKTDGTQVPGVTADVDETPAFVKYGAAVILGLAFGVGCYVWIDGGVPTAPQTADNHIKVAPTEEYFTHAGTYANPSAQGVLPDPFVSPFEPSLESLSDLPDGTMRELATDESVEPIAPADYPMTSGVQ